MKWWPVAALAAVAVLAFAGIAIFFSDDPGDRSISYVLDGGSLDDGYPTSYTEGEALELPVPERDGYVFTGWFLDPGLTDPIQSVTPDTRGDLVLHAGWIPAVSHSIIYDLDGGTQTEDAPASFIGGIGVRLPMYPEKDGCEFAGWFLDGDPDRPVVVIGTDVFEDVHVTAMWDPADLAGIGYMWDVSGSYMNGSIPHSMEGTVRSEWIAEAGGEWYVEVIYDILYTWPNGSTVDDRVVGSWTSTRMSGLAYQGMEEVGGYVCTVWDDGEGHTYWLHRLNLVVRSTYDYGTFHIVHELSDVYSFVPETSFILDVTAEHPLDVVGAGEAEIGVEVTLTAVGEGFTGWYIGRELVSADRVLTISRVDPTLSLEARAARGYTILEGPLDSYGIPADAVITDADGADAGAGEIPPGYYVATYADGHVTKYMEFFVEGSRTFSHTWEHGGRTYTVSVEMLYSDVYRCTYDHPYGTRVSLGIQGYIENYHTPDDPYLREVLVILEGYGEGMDRIAFAELVLSFVQTLPYIDDTTSSGNPDWWKYPLETLWDGGGDCEDSAILYDTLMIMAGYRTAFVLFQDHAMSAVELDVPGHCVTEDGVTYVFCETTAVFQIGEAAPGHREGDVYFWCPVGLTAS